MEKFAEKTKMILPLTMAAQLFAAAPQEAIAGEKLRQDSGKGEPVPTEILECMKTDRYVDDIIVDLAKPGGRESFRLFKRENDLTIDRGSVKAEILPKSESGCRIMPKSPHCHDRLELKLAEKDNAWHIIDYDLNGIIDKATKFCGPENPGFFNNGPNETCGEYDVADKSKQNPDTLRMFQEVRKTIIDKLKYVCSVWKNSKREGDFLVNRKQK